MYRFVSLGVVDFSFEGAWSEISGGSGIAIQFIISH